MTKKTEYEKLHPPLVKGVRYRDTFKLKTPISRDGESRGSRKARRTFRRGG